MRASVPGAEDPARAESAFALPGRLAAKADPALIEADERHFAAIGECLQRSIAELSDRLAAERNAPGGAGQEAMDRDLEIHRLTARLRALRRFGLDLCLGRIVGAGAAEVAGGGAGASGSEDPAGAEPVYIGRFGLTDAEGRRLLVDWRSPAAEPFFGATLANPMGLASRRRYRWTRGRISDYWDEVFAADGFEGNAALDDQSAFIASLGSSRSPRMRDVLATIQTDQDAIIRRGSHGALVVDGGPGTGKTVVALHRAAYLLYSEPRVARGGVLFVGPSPAYLDYIEDVLPSLGEEGVHTCALRDLVAGGSAFPAESDPGVAALKSSADLVRAVDAAVRFHERPPRTELEIQTPWCDLRLDEADWAEAFGAADPAATHNEARDQVWEALLDILIDRADDDEIPPHLLRRSLQQSDELVRAFATAWPLLDPAGVIADLWSVPAYLRACAPWLAPAELRRLQRPDGRAWTVSDLPFLDAAQLSAGDPRAARRARRREAALAAAREEMSRVVDDLIASDDSELRVMSILRGQDAQNSLVDEAALPGADPDLLAGPFAHIVVDEAQELTDAEWQMLLRRCPSRSFTIVGDRAQARRGFTETWRERLERIGLDRIEVESLSINYRTPIEVMAEAEPVIRAALPDANVPASVRSTGVPVMRGPVSGLDEILRAWLREDGDGIACVISERVALPGTRSGASPAPDASTRPNVSTGPGASTGLDASTGPGASIGLDASVGPDSSPFSGAPSDPRVRWLTPELSKGLEFDLVVLIDPEGFGPGIEGAVDRYVAMTRATQRLVILSTDADADARRGETVAPALS